MPTPEQVRDAVTTYVETFQKGDKEGWVQNFAEDAVHQDPNTAPPNVGREAIARFWDTTHQLAERIEFDVEDVIVAGDEAVLVFTLRAYSGEGTGVEFRAVDVFTIDDDGLISREKAYFDLSTMRPSTA
jgi:steroid delta-isomerase